MSKSAIYELLTLFLSGNICKFEIVALKVHQVVFPWIDVKGESNKDDTFQLAENLDLVHKI